MATTIVVSMETKEVLHKHGEKGESCDYIIHKLIEEVDWRASDNRWNRILETERFMPLDEL